MPANSKGKTKKRAAAPPAKATGKRPRSIKERVTARDEAHPASPPLAEQVEAAIASMKQLGTKRVRDDMGARYGIVGPTAERAFGVSMANMKLLAERLTRGRDGARNHALAAALWDTGWYEARMVASMVDDAAHVTPGQMDDWCRDFDNWAICDTVCFKLFDGVAPDLAFRKVRQWSTGSKGVPGGNDEFVTRGSFALLACVALHNNLASEKQLLDCLPLIERGAADERNFVKKGVSWALRSVGRRTPSLRAAAVALSRRLAESSVSSAARWVGRDALKDLTKT